MAKILIVDDDKFTRTVLETIFRQDRSFVGLGIEVLTAANGEEGLRQFKQHQPDAVVLDLLMPLLDGFGLCKGIRSLPEGASIHLAVMSGVYRDNAIAARLSNEYDAHFFAKPYQLKDMTRFVAELIAAGKRTVAGDSQATFVETGIEQEVEEELLNPTAEQVSTGELATRALPALLLDFLDAEATGRLLVRRGKVSKTIELLLGHPIAVTSTLRDETLGQLLVANGVITEAQHREALAQASKQATRLGEALIDLGVLTPEQLSAHLTGQLRHKLVSCLRWPTGLWRFEPDANVQTAQRGGTIDGLSTIVSGLRDSVDVAHPPPYMREASSSPLFLTPRGHRLLDSLNRHVAPNLAELWRDGATMDELAGYGIVRSALATAVDILLLAGGVEVEKSQEHSQPGVGFDSIPGLSVEQLSEHSQMARISSLADDEEHADELYDSLFDDGSTAAPLPTGADPLEVAETDGIPDAVEDGASGIIDVAGMSTEGDTPDAAAREQQRARRTLLHEFLRIQGLDVYGVLKVEHSALEATISAAAVERRSKFDMDWYGRFELGRDYAKLEQLHAAYEHALDTLLDPEKRAAYDRGDPSTEETGHRAPPLEAEISFGVAEELIAAGDYENALEKLADAIANAPEDATYIATLGWVSYLKGERKAAAADEARRYINEALSKNPDSAVSHAFKGVIGADLADDDDDARFHLESALDADPCRADALEALETIWHRSGEFRPLEKLYRRMIYRTAGRDAVMELLLWRKLADLYRDELDDLDKARVAYESAARLSPNDRGVRAALQDLEGGAPNRFFERAEVLRSHWRRDPSVAGPGLELLRAAEQASRPDATFMVASALVARGLASPDAELIYQRHRPRFLVRAQQLLDQEAWSKVRHTDDAADIGYLLELVADAVAPEMPLSLDDLEIDEGALIDETMLPPGFVKVRAYVAHLLGVRIPAVYLRSDFGRQIHVGAVEPPILLAGDDALAGPERSELGFRLGRAMTYLYPGRALGGSRPSRFIKAAVLAAWQMATPDAALSPKIDDPDGLIARLEQRLNQLHEERQSHIRAVIADISGRQHALNLSRWSRGMARTADRMGMTLCGDLPAAVRFASEVSGSTGTADMVDYAISGSHMLLRSYLGLSIDI